MSVKHPRLECPYCQEILSYSSYHRHIETKFCCKIEFISSDALSHHNDSGNSDLQDTSYDAHPQECNDYINDQSIANDDAENLDSEIPSDPDSSTEILAPEIWPEEAEPDADSVESEKILHEKNHKLLCAISFFVFSSSCATKYQIEP